MLQSQTPCPARQFFLFAVLTRRKSRLFIAGYPQDDKQEGDSNSIIDRKRIAQRVRNGQRVHQHPVLY